MKTATLIFLALWITVVRGQANETYKACQTVMTCFQDAEDEIDKCLSILIGEKSASGPGPTEPPKLRPPNADDCMTPVKEKIKQKKVLDKERVQEFKKCLSLRIESGAEDVDPRKYRYCTTVTGRYQNKTSEAGIRFKRQAALPELPTLSTQLAANSSTAIPVSHSTQALFTGSSLPIHSSSFSSISISSSSSSAIANEALLSGEPKNATSGGGVDPLPQLVNSTQVAESSSLPPQHSSASIPSNPSLQIGLNSSPVSGAPVGLNSSPSSSIPEISTLEHTSPRNGESSQPPPVQPQQLLNSSIAEPLTIKPAEPLPVSIEHAGSSSTIWRAPSATTTEIEYEYSGSSGGSSSEVGAAKPLRPSNPIVETLNQQHNNISEPSGPPSENSTKVELTSESTIHPVLTTLPNGIHPPGAKAPGARQNGQRPLKPQQASDIDANGADQEQNQQRVKIEVLREARRRLSEFKGCMARARIKREECKPLVRCCPDTAICHLNYESSDLHNKVHKLESEILQGRQECVKRKRALNKDELADAMDQIDAEELISDDSVVSQIIF